MQKDECVVLSAMKEQARANKVRKKISPNLFFVLLFYFAFN
jgi:hypothetical protein